MTDSSVSESIRDTSETGVPIPSRNLLWLSLIAAVTAFAFAPSLQNEFVNWDDDRLLTGNPHYRGLGLSQLRWMFSTDLMGHYQPLTWLSFGLDHAVWGMSPRGYHFTSVCLHVANAAVFFLVARRLVRAAVGWRDGLVGFAAGMAALCFSVHPLRVESVAWITERRDVLSGLFLLLTLWAYLRSLEPGARRAIYYFMAVVMYAASLLSKATAVGMPLVLLILDGYPLDRWRTAGSSRDKFRLMVEKIPFVLLAFAAAVLAVRAEQHAETVAELSSHGPARRALQAAFGLCFYIAKSVWPFGLTPLVPVPDSFSALGWHFGVCVVAVVGAGLLVFVMRRRWPALAAIAAFYVLMLLPVLGIVQIGPQLVADRYSYLPSLGVSLAAGAAAAALRARLAAIHWAGRRLVDGMLVVLLIGLVILTQRQVRFWRDSVSLFTRMVRYAPESAIANLGLATALAERGRVRDSVPYFRESVRLRPSFAQAHYDLGVALLGLDRLDESRQSFELAVALRPDDARAWSNLGAVHLRRGDLEGARSALERAVELQPAGSLPLYNLGLVHVRLGALDEALRAWRRAAEAAPESVPVLEILAWHLATAPDESLRDGAAAVVLAERASWLSGGRNASVMDVLAAAYAERGDFDRAERTADRALDLARRDGLLELARGVESRLQLYRAGRPARDDAARHAPEGDGSVY